MALISCPECTKEISDRVKTCPHCGYPLVEENKETQKVELTSVNVKIEEEKKKRIFSRLISLVVIISIIIGGTTVYSQQKKKKEAEVYINSIYGIIETMHSNALRAEKLLNLTYKVWYNAIYEESDSETDKYTQIDGKWVDDFNVAIDKLYLDEEATTGLLQNAQERISKDIKELRNIPEEYAKSHEALLELYNAYQRVADLAVNPKGNLTSFGDSKDERIDKYIEAYRKLETQLPQ